MNAEASWLDVELMKEFIEDTDSIIEHYCLIGQHKQEAKGLPLKEIQNYLKEYKQSWMGRINVFLVRYGWNTEPEKVLAYRSLLKEQMG